MTLFNFLRVSYLVLTFNIVGKVFVDIVPIIND